MRLALAGIVIALGLNAFVARAQDPTATDLLLQRLGQVEHLQGRFTQRQLDENASVLVESAGDFKLLRPHYFIWEITSPDRQLIVADADYLWHYDIDLQTVTRRPVAGSVDASPLQVLGGDEALLREAYNVQQNSAESFTLTPLNDAQSFRQLTVLFDANTLSRLDILDKLGQRVVVELEDVDAATSLTPDDFLFTPPAGDVDLFYYDD